MQKMGWFGTVRGHSGSATMPHFDRAHTTSYSTLIETMCLSCTVFGLQCLKCLRLFCSQQNTELHASATYDRFTLPTEAATTVKLQRAHTHTHTHTRLTALFRDYPGEPVPLTVSCFSKIQIGFIFLVPAHLGSPGKGPLNGCVCVCVCVCAL